MPLPLLRKDENMKITSSAFEDGGVIPKKYTGFGEDRSPGLSVTGVPEGTVSLALVLDDLDVPFCRRFTHWVAWGLPADGEIPEGMPAGASVTAPVRAFQGRAWGKHRYRGPKQPFFLRSAHRYVFTVYALNFLPDLPADAGRGELLSEAAGHILAEAALTGIHGRGMI